MSDPNGINLRELYEQQIAILSRWRVAVPGNRFLSHNANVKHNAMVREDAHPPFFRQMEWLFVSISALS